MRSRRYKTQEFGFIPPWRPTITLAIYADNDDVDKLPVGTPIIFKTTMEVTVDPGFTVLDNSLTSSAAVRDEI